VIVQPIFHVPLDIEVGLLSGEFIRYGGVVRDTAGRLVTHLKEIPTPETAVAEASKRAALSLKNPWVVVGVGVLTLVAVGGGVVLALKQRKKDAEPVVPECVKKYTHSLRLYLDAIQSGTLDAQTIDRLLVDLEAVVAYGEEGETLVAFSPDRACQMVCVRGGSPYGRKHTVGYRQGGA